MRILHILSQRPDSTGSGIYLQAMLNQSDSQGNSNGLLAATNADHHKLPILPVATKRIVTFETDELDFSLPGMSDTMPYRSSIFSLLSQEQLHLYHKAFLTHLTLLIDDFQPDLIHAHHLWLLSSLTKKHFSDIPMVVSCHGSDLRQFHLCPQLQDSVLSGCRHIDHVLALTEHQKRQINADYGVPLERISVAGAGYDTTIFYPSARKGNSKWHLLYCGKLSGAKGVPQLLKSLHQLSNIPFHIHLVGSGSGSEETHCQQLAEHLSNRATLHGALTQTSLAHLLRRIDCFVLPSLFEGLPLVILEALACGCRAIASDLPGCREIYNTVGKEFMQLVPLPPLTQVDQLSPEEEALFIVHLKNTLSTEYQHHLKRQPLASRENMPTVTTFSWDAVFKRVALAYDGVLE